MRLAALTFSAIVLAGCSAISTQPAVPEFATPKPVARTTPYTKPLACLGDLYGTYSSNNTPLLVSVMPASDVTGASQATSAEVPREFTLMVETAVNSVSPRIRIINVDHEFQVRENAVGGKFNRVAPRILLKPAISEFDRGLAIMTAKQDLSGFFGKGKGSTDFSVDRSREEATARIGVDMMAYEYGTMSSIPNVHASVGAEVGRKGANNGWSLSIYGWGVGNTSSTKAIQARHEAVRILSEYAVLQTLGRYLKLPYWRCVDGMAEDPVVKQSLSSYHQKLDDKARVASLQELLQYHGFELEKSGVVDANTKEAISSLRVANPEAVNSADASELYYRLYVSIPVGNVPDAHGWRLVMPAGVHNRTQSNVAQVSPTTNTPMASVAPTSAISKEKAVKSKPEAIQTKLSLSMPNGAPKRGEPISLQLGAATDMYAYCFLQEADGAIQLFYPNRFVKTAKLSAGQTLSMPGKMGFELAAQAQGKQETVVCFGTKSDVTASLPRKGKDFEKLPVSNLQELGQMIARANGGTVEAANLSIQAQ